MGLRTKLMGFALAVALLAPVVGVFAYVRLESVGGRLRSLSEDYVPDALEVAKMNQIQTDEQLALVSYVATGSGDARKQYEISGLIFDSELRQLRQRAISAGYSSELRDLITQLSAEREQFKAAGAQIVTVRETYDRSLETMGARYNELTDELNQIRRRFVASSQGAGDAATIPQSLRYQVNDLLLGTEGMQNVAAVQSALVSTYALKPTAEIRGTYEADAARFPFWYRVALNAGGPDDRPILTRVQKKAEEFDTAARTMLAATDQFTTSRATLAQSAGAIKIALDRVGAHELLSVEAGHTTTDREISDSKILILVISVAGFVVAGVLGAWFAETITRPVVRLRDLANRVSKGDLSDTEIDIKRDDEIGELATAFRRMVASLRFTLRRRGTTADTVEAERAAS
jgi:methyl-accepting chemotaxis protein